MDYAEYNKCIEILRLKPKWFGTDENIPMKLDCLETFRSKGSPSNIHALIPFLKSNDEIFRQRTAGVITSLFDKLKSQNQLYDSLKYLPVDVSDVDFFSKSFPRDVSVKLLALSSLNHSGYVRQRAIEALTLAKHPQAIRFLILRLSDWVKNVREAAASSIRKYFIDEYREQFISELDNIDGLKNVGRTDLTTEYESILGHILEKKLNTESYSALTVTDKARLLYLKKYIEKNGIDSQLTKILISDKSFLTRIQVLKHLNELNPSEQSRIILQLLNDKSSQVRLQTLYYLRDNSIQYYDIILKLTSDLSASIRDLARYLLRTHKLNFREIYKDRIQKHEHKVGSILGLAEVATTNDLDFLKTVIEIEDKNTRLACLVGIQKLDVQQAKGFALKLFADEPNKIRKRCIEILSRTWDRDVILETEQLYENANPTLKRMILTLYTTVGGWDVLGMLIKATSDKDSTVKELAWNFLQKWKDKALRLFTRPPKEAMDKATRYYEQTVFNRTEISPSRQKLWDEIRYYLRYD
ncbi:HEAT repeat domain-containing protein [Chryseolinea sp. H1M3-3]|uniref:HEAT repeat domain-containing protein n=1 Tax=Chryseolinea sp. H1M3-3 TaxID=3034144 RepID=UPI0023EDC2AD|nr:HEAT repeat domain-containing protein [Chryseolinea sp. H1M3-3]